MTSTDASESLEGAADWPILFHGLTEIGAATWGKPAVPAQQWADGGLIDDHQPDQDRGSCGFAATGCGGDGPENSPTLDSCRMIVSG